MYLSDSKHSFLPMRFVYSFVSSNFQLLRPNLLLGRTSFSANLLLVAYCIWKDWDWIEMLCTRMCTKGGTVRRCICPPGTINRVSHERVVINVCTYVLDCKINCFANTLFTIYKFIIHRGPKYTHTPVAWQAGDQTCVP